MNPWYWEIVGTMMVLGSTIGYATSIWERISVGDLTTAESSVITQALIVVGLILGFVFQQVGLWQMRRDAHKQHEKDKHEADEKAIQLAELVRLQATEVALRAQLSHAETIAHLNEVKASTTVALEAANHSNEKITALAKNIDTTLQIVPPLAAAIVNLQQVKPSVERTPGTLLTETPQENKK